ncbi:hypothetical protein PHISCL_03627 [Aspergillus sclerotialis]|uniref:Uncharacterized protein n=1 Tax=Aspergillus sclerotialis TaxID=2070753 RepID=A0A3A2ZP54_9EURO|nr:hypothetical protein PHISCL_03627 [Aspergillus sclerotialis]
MTTERYHLRPKPRQVPITYRWLDEDKYPRLARKIRKYSSLPEGGFAAESDSEDRAFQPEPTPPSPPVSEVASDSIPSSPEPLDVDFNPFDLDLEVITPDQSEGESEDYQDRRERIEWDENLRLKLRIAGYGVPLENKNGEPPEGLEDPPEKKIWDQNKIKTAPP